MSALKKKYIIFIMIIVLMLCAISMAFLFQTQMVAFATNLDDNEIQTAQNDNTFKNVQFSGKAIYFIDQSTGTIMYSKNENERLPIASMVKIMTALLTFEEIEKGGLSLEQEIVISENAAKQGGSQVFLDANSKHKVGELLKAVIVASANDAAVALGETISGSIEGFINKMNARANELGMNNTHFSNITGLPAPENYSSAKDVSVMFSKLIQYPKYFDYSKIWLEDYVHPDGRKTTITNTNKLVRHYKGCDGGKTGFTSEAKFCLAATAMRDNMRLICVVIGSDSSKARFKCVSDLFNAGFQNYSNKILLEKDKPIERKIEIRGGKQNQLFVASTENICEFMSKADKEKFEIIYELPEYIKAPVRQGEVVGKAILIKNGVALREYKLTAFETVEKSNFFDDIKRIGDNWNLVA